MIGVLFLVLPSIFSFQIQTTLRRLVSRHYSLDDEYLEWEREETDALVLLESADTLRLRSYPIAQRGKKISKLAASTVVQYQLLMDGTPGLKSSEVL